MPSNINISQGNFSFGPTVGLFYTMSQSLQTLLVVEADGTPAASFPITLSTLRNPVSSLKYDGTFFWSLEDLPSSLGVVIKKWRLYPFPTAALPSVSPSECRWQDELTLINSVAIKWASRAIGVEYYKRLINGSVARGSTSIVLNSVANISLGDKLYLGPSTFTGFVGNEETVTVTNIVSNTILFSKVGGLENSYNISDPVDFHKAVWLFNDHSFSGQEDYKGDLVKFSWPAKATVFSNQGAQYSLVQAADFNGTELVFVRADQIMRIDTATSPSLVYSSLEANLRESDLATPIVVYDIIADLVGNQVYKLQHKETVETISTGAYVTSTWSSGSVPLYNYQIIATLAFVNSTALSFDTRMTFPFVTADKINIIGEVRDQYNLPVPSKTVQFSSSLNPLSGAGTPGTFSPTSAVTNASGIVSTQYTPSVTVAEILVDVQAKVL